MEYIARSAGMKVWAARLRAQNNKRHKAARGHEKRMYLCYTEKRIVSF